MNNPLKIGDKVEYETMPNPDTHETELIPGTIVRFLPGNRLVLRTQLGQEIDVFEEYCEPIYDCFQCFDTGFVETAGEEINGKMVYPKIKCKCRY